MKAIKYIAVMLFASLLILCVAVMMPLNDSTNGMIGTIAIFLVPFCMLIALICLVLVLREK